jgi:hypothetical protein
VNGQGRLQWHGVDEIDGLPERPGDIGIGVLVEADVGVADLQEQRNAGTDRRGAPGGGGEVDGS